MLAGTPPVNTNISGSGSLPRGVLFTAINASFADREDAEKGYDGPYVYSQTWLLKMRYGLTDNLELGAIVPYMRMGRSHPTTTPKYIEGLGDVTAGFNFAPFNLHQGDPVALSFVAAAIVPTAPQGKNHLPGSGAWGGRASAALGFFATDNIKLDTELVWSAPFERGNQKVRRCDMYQWNAQMRYVWDNYDVALESSFVKQESGDRSFAGGRRNIKNGYSECFVGPSFNAGFRNIDAWAGLGIYFPVHQSFSGPNISEDYRVEFKIGKLW